MIKNIGINEFNKIYSIMENSFPETEFRPKHKQKELFKNKFYQVFAIKDGDDILSFAAIWNFESFIFIEHLATSPSHRNMGFGGKILQEILNSTHQLVCFEVEPPYDDLTRRRIGFYERNGLFFNDFPYIQPSISEGRNPIPLFIMTSNGKIDEETFIDIKNTLYKEVYNSIS